MIVTIIANVFRFIALMLLQVLVLDHLDIANGWMVPYLYLLFLLMLPFELPAWASLLIGAFTGLVMDLFSNTPGMHMSACVIMMFVRLRWLKLIAPREGYEFGMRPTVPRMGLVWFVTYAGVLILIHHLWLFFVEIHRFDSFFSTFLRAVLSAVFTLGLCLLAQFLTSREERGRT
ncbi:MAG: rod shape-determining protein MreD [Flavobacteriales bacterium]|nr:rod shape-determining protein MreD [Flavobacteriales bacterium]